MSENIISKNHKQITTKQIFMLIFLIGMSIKIFLMPVLLLKNSGRDSYIPVIAFLIIEFICLTVLLKVNKMCPDSTFFELLESIFRKIGAKIVTAIIALYLIFKLMLVITDVKVFFIVSIYENLPWPVFVIPLLVLYAVIASKGLKSIARTSEIFAPFVAVSVILMCFLMSENIDFTHLLPFMEHGAEKSINSFLKFPMWYGDFSVFIVFLGYIKRTKNTNKVAMISCAITSAIVLLFALMVFSAYADVGHLLQYGQNVSNLTQITLAGFNLGRLDIIIFGIWLISVLIKGALVFFIVARSAEYVVGLKNTKYMGFILAGVTYILLVFVFPNEILFRDLLISYLSIPTLIVQYSIPILMIIGAVKKASKAKKYCKESLYAK